MDISLLPLGLGVNFDRDALVFCNAVNENDKARQHLYLELHDEKRDIRDIDLDEAGGEVLRCDFLS